MVRHPALSGRIIIVITAAVPEPPFGPAAPQLVERTAAALAVEPEALAVEPAVVRVALLVEPQELAHVQKRLVGVAEEGHLVDRRAVFAAQG